MKYMNMKKRYQPLDLQFFAEGGDGNNGDDSGDDEGDDQDDDDSEEDGDDDDPDEKKYSQKEMDDAVKRRLAREKRKWQREQQKQKTKPDGNDYVGDGSTGGCTVLTTGNHAYSPALLIECCFVDDKDDADRWSASRCANAIYRGITGAAAASWVKDSIGWWYHNADGSYPRSCWKEIDGDWYYFNAKGYALASEWILYKNKWYYLKEDCRMAKGWAEVENEWYYLDSGRRRVVFL